MNLSSSVHVEYQACCDLMGILKKRRKHTHLPGSFSPDEKTAVQEEDSLLVQEMNALSVEERENVFEEIHGVSKVPEETPEFVENAFKSLQHEISELPRNRRKAMDRAFFLKPTLQHDPKFQLLFLRAERFNGFYAARRMSNYFESKLELFGPDKLVSKITLEDMEDDREALYVDSFQVLPQKDRAGRTVWVITLNKFKNLHWKSFTRAFWYQMMSMLDDEECQINGMVDITYCVGMEEPEGSVVELLSKGAPMTLALPYRMCAIHCCFNDVKLKPVMSFIQFIVGKQNRMRFRTHFGTDMEILYALMSFGIPVDTLAINPDGTIQQDVFMNYMEGLAVKEELWRQEQEEIRKLSRYVEYPNRNDILLGRGKPFQEFPGNLNLASIVSLHRDRYKQSTERFEKMCMAADIVKHLQDAGCRFLKRTPEGWEEVSDDAARDKVGAALRMKGTSSANNNAKLADMNPPNSLRDFLSMQPGKRLLG